jgi:rifampicin phosphotransferase
MTNARRTMLTLDHPTTETTWDAPGPGPWRQDRAHLPASISPMLQAAYPDGINRGFAETFAAWGIVLDGITWTCVNGFPYLQLLPFDAPGPDGPRTPDYRRSGLREPHLA